MDWKILTATFSAVFVAELADKTQLVGIAMASRSGKPVSVWIGSVAAYMIVTIISVWLGVLLSKAVRPEWIRMAGGLLFVFVGLLMFFGKI